MNPKRKPQAPTDWYESEQPTRVGMVAELQRIRRRTGVRPLPVLALALVITAGVTYKFAMKPRRYTADVVLAMSEGAMGKERDASIPFDQLKEYVANVLLPDTELLQIIEKLQGFEAPAGDWERFLLPARLESYDPAWLDLVSLSGQVVWGRLRPSQRSEEKGRPMRAMTRSIPVTLMLRKDLPWLTAEEKSDEPVLSGTARDALAAIERHGALFAPQLARLGDAPPAG